MPKKRFPGSVTSKKRKKVTGIRKGGRFERSVCQTLSLWITNGLREDVFWRSASSGGRFTRKGKDVRAHAGDICATHPKGQVLLDLFVVECKHYRWLEADKLLWGFQGALLRFWSQVLRDSLVADRIPLLLAKQDFRDPIVVTTDEGFDIFRLGAGRTEDFEPWFSFPGECLVSIGLQQILTDVDWDGIEKQRRTADYLRRSALDRLRKG